MVSSTLQRETQIPQVTGAIARPRLLATLQSALEHKLTLICAPPGYGKTTIAAQFASQTPEAVAWQTLEERDRDLPNLYNQALHALDTIVPGTRNLIAMPGFRPGEMATLLTDHLRANTSRPVLLVLDDIQLISGAIAAEAWLQAFVEQIPSTLHLVLIGRVLPNLPLTEMIARGEVLALGQEQLRFTPTEIYELARDSRGVVRTMAEAEDLAARLEGWPAGTVLALHPLPAELERAILQGGAGPEALFDALANSMLEMQPPGLRDFLLSASTLLRITPDLCTNVLQLTNAAHWLAETQQRNLFLSRVAGGFVFHRLFRNFLQRQLEQTNPELYLSLHTRAAEWFRAQNLVDWSFEHYLAADLIEQAAALADEVALTFFSQGKSETLLEWRGKLGAERVLAPNLLYHCARVLTDRYRYDQAEQTLDEAQRIFASLDDHAGVARVRLQKTFITLQRGNFRDAAMAAAQLTHTLPEEPDLRGNAYKILGVAHLRIGEIAAGIQYLEQALELHRRDGDAYALANVLQDLSVAFWQVGRFDRANACLQEVVALRRSLGSPGALAAALNNLGSYYHMGGQYEQAAATYQEGLSIVARVPDRRVESALLWSLGELRRDQGLFEDALKLHNRALALIGSSDPWLRCAVMVSSSTLYRWWGRLREAESYAEKACTLAGQFDLALEKLTAKAALWATRTHQNHAEGARAVLEDLIGELQNQEAHSELARIQILAAAAALLLNDEPGAEQHLKRALREAQSIGSIQVLAAEVINTPVLDMHVAKHAHKYSELVIALKHLRFAQLNAQRPARLNQVTPSGTYSLRAYTLGREHLERDGIEVVSADWRSNAAQGLFYYLLFKGPASREQISLVFWPDSSASRVRSNFHTTLYRTRRTLGENVIVFENGMYALDPNLDLWCDAHEFEQLVRQARLLPIRDARTEDLWRRAVALYRGDFLPSWDREWTDVYRTELMDMFLEALVRLGQCASARHDPREAIAVLRRALEIDPYREDVHRMIMTCYAELGEKNQVLNQLQKLEFLLEEELAISPSDETVALARALLA